MSSHRSQQRYAIALLAVREIIPNTHSLENASRLTGMHPALILYYCRRGLLGPSPKALGPESTFDDDSVHGLLRFQSIRRELHLERRTALLICMLMHQVESLQKDLQYHRSPNHT